MDRYELKTDMEKAAVDKQNQNERTRGLKEKPICGAGRKANAILWYRPTFLGEHIHGAKRHMTIRKITNQVQSTLKEYIYAESELKHLRLTAQIKAVTVYERVIRMPEDSPLRIIATKRIGLKFKKKIE